MTTEIPIAYRILYECANQMEEIEVRGGFFFLVLIVRDSWRLLKWPVYTKFKHSETARLPARPSTDYSFIFIGFLPSNSHKFIIEFMGFLPVHKSWTGSVTPSSHRKEMLYFSLEVIDSI